MFNKTSKTIIGNAVALFTQAQTELQQGIDVGTKEADIIQDDIKELTSKLTATNANVQRAKNISSNISKLLDE